MIAVVFLRLLYRLHTRF